MEIIAILCFFGSMGGLSVTAVLTASRPSPNVEFENYSHKYNEDFLE